MRSAGHWNLTDRDRRRRLWATLFAAGLLIVGFRPARLADPQPVVATRPVARSRIKSRHTLAARWKIVIERTYENIGNDRVVALAAGVTFYSILALFPAIAALVSLYGLFADPASISSHLDTLAGILPGGAMQVIGDELQRLVAQGSTKLGVTFLLGLAIALWSANAGIKSLFDALNLVYKEHERRGFIELNAVSLVFTTGVIGFGMVALGAMIVLPVLLSYIGPGISADSLLPVLRWPALLITACFCLTVLYRFGPSRPNAQWKWITWGSAFASVGWLVVSLLFTWYAANFGTYNKTYGSLGAIVGFMVWIWLSAIVVLLGAEIDAQFERLSVKSSSVEQEN